MMVKIDTSFSGRFDSTESGRKFGQKHFVFTIFMQNVWFYICTSCAWLCLRSFLFSMRGSKQLFWQGRLRKWRIANSSEGKCDRCTFKKMHITILFFIRSSCGLLHYREKTFIYNFLAYVLDKFLLWKWEKLSYCRVTFFQLWHFVFFKQSLIYC